MRGISCHSHSQNVFENVVCKMAVILYETQLNANVIWNNLYKDDTWVSWRLKSLATQLFIFYPSDPQGSGVLSSPGRPGGRACGRAVKHHYGSHVHNSIRIISKLGKDIHCPKISDDCDYGRSASLNMRIIDHLMSRTFWHSRAHFSR